MGAGERPAARAQRRRPIALSADTIDDTVGELRGISADEFVRRVVATTKESDKRYAFLLGAGCSISSGIPAAGTLVRDEWLPRLHRLRAPQRKDLEGWITEEFPDHDPGLPAASYGPVMEALFLQPEERQREIERLCDGKFPGFGYAVLANVMALPGGRFNVTLTTNFDDLVQDAMYLFTNARPLVIQHESLARFIRPTRSRPLVVKLHGDNRLSPLNTGAETAEVEKEIETQVGSLLHDRGLIVVGYGGADRGIAKMLSALPPEALPLGVYWVSGTEPRGVVREWLEQRGAIWVRHGDFDQLMLLFQAELDLPHPDSRRLDAVFKRYSETYEALSARVAQLPDEAPDAVTLKAAVQRGDETATDWWAVHLAAERAINAGDLDAAEGLYEEGVKRFPNAAWLAQSYGIFLTLRRGRYDDARGWFDRALQLEPDDPDLLGNVAMAIDIAGDFDRADELFELALSHDPEHVNNMRNWASRLARRDEVERARALLEGVAASADATGNHLGSVAYWLMEWGDYDEAGVLLEKALSLDPNEPTAMMNQAALWYLRGDLEAADARARQAVEGASVADRNDLEREALWLRTTYGDVEHRAAAVARLRELAAVAPSPTFRFLYEPHLAAAGARAPFLRALAETLHGERDVSELDAFEEWQAS